MKITFKDQSFIELIKSIDGIYIISIQAKDYKDPLKKITNSVELSQEQLDQLVKDIGN